jgi:hypothetical protein
LGTVQQDFAPRRSGTLEDGFEELPCDAVGEFTLERARACVQHKHAGVGSLLARTRGQRRLTGARRALDDDERAVPAGGRSDRSIERT